MTATATTWDPPARLRGPVLHSLVGHLLLFALIAGYFIWRDWGREMFGDPKAMGGGAVTVTPVASIPLPRPTGRPNPVADDTESQAPPLPQPEPQRPAAPAPEPEAIKIPTRKPDPVKPKPEPRREFKRTGETEPNQVATNQGQRMVSPMMGSRTSGSGVGVGPSSPFGTRFGYYADLIRQRVAEKWNTSDIPPNIKTAPMAIVSFDILRNGTVRSVRVAQPSGLSALDYSAQRAILDAAPFPPLPAGFQRDSATVEFQFQFQR